MNQLEIINSKLQELNTELVTYANSVEFEEICEFNLQDCATSIPWDRLVFSGIYLFEIKNDLKHLDFRSWVDNFRDEWEHQKYKPHFVSNLRKVRVDKHKDLKEWVPIYIGKSKMIGGRIHQHIYKELEKPTFALKLNARENMKNHTFKLSAINVSAQNYDWVMPVFESTLRDRINPILGRQ